MERTPSQRIVDAHVICNVTPLVSRLLDYDDDFARDLMLGSGKADDEAYEVWRVSDWLAGQLTRRGHRVEKLWQQHYWARGGTGQAVYMDDVIEQIAAAVSGTGSSRREA